MLEGIKTINTDDIIKKTLYHLERVKINKVVMLPVSEKENMAVIEWARNAPDIIIPFFNPPERLDDSKGIKDIIEKAILEDNYKGFKIMVSFRKKKLNDKILYPVLETAHEHKLPVLFHTGYPPPGTQKSVLTFSNPIVIDEYVNSFPDAKIIIAHMGYPWVDNALALAVQYPNIYLDISNMTYMMPNRLKDFLLYAKELIGLDKILFGSDGFVPEMIEIAVNYFNNVNFLTKEEIDNILGLNAQKLLKIE